MKSKTSKNKQVVYVALLRGINVGGNNTVSMAKLKACFEKLGFSNPKTFINSGNIIFKTAKESDATLVTKIEKAVEKEFGFAVRVVVRNKKQISDVCKSMPKNWVTDKEMRTEVLFLWNEVDNKKEVSKIEINPKVDKIIYKKGSVIWNFDRKNYNQSKMYKIIGTNIYKHMTGRNANTTRKLLSLMNEYGKEE